MTHDRLNAVQEEAALESRGSVQGPAAGTPLPPSLTDLLRELEQFDREADERRRFRTELKDLREGLSERRLRERLGPFLVRVEKFSTQFIRHSGDAELGRSLFTPWISQLVGTAAEPAWRIPGGFDALQRWCWRRYRTDEERVSSLRASATESPTDAPP